MEVNVYIVHNYTYQDDVTEREENYYKIEILVLLSTVLIHGVLH